MLIIFYYKFFIKYFIKIIKIRIKKINIIIIFTINIDLKQILHIYNNYL